MPSIPGKTLPRLPSGSGRVPERQKMLVDVVQQLSRVSSPQGATWTTSGLYLTPPGAVFMPGQTGDDGIPAFDGTNLTGSTVTQAVLSFVDPNTLTWGLTDNTFIGFNLSTQDVQPNVNTIFVMLMGFWVCVWEDCT
jgi:hypothetical protein